MFVCRCQTSPLSASVEHCSRHTESQFYSRILYTIIPSNHSPHTMRNLILCLVTHLLPSRERRSAINHPPTPPPVPPSPPPSPTLSYVPPASRRTGCWGYDFTAATTSWYVSTLPTHSGCWTCTNVASPLVTKMSSSPSRRRARVLGEGKATCTQ